MTSTTTTTTPSYQIRWEKLPDDYNLPDDPVDNINQPPLAAALTESLIIAEKVNEKTLISTNYGICAIINDKIVIKAPDWAYINEIIAPREEVIRSYTPQLQGQTPLLVLEFLSDSDGGEYSVKQTYPPGKFFFYEKILQVPNYGIFDPKTGVLEFYKLNGNKSYQLQPSNQRYWLAEMNLFLGVWQGNRENRQGYWLRWWDEQENLLLWGTEKIAQERQRAEQERQRAEQERQRAEQERQRAEQEHQRAEKLVAQLRAMGIEPE